MKIKDKYTEIGKKIACLGKNQTEISEVISLTQQSVSGKINGRIAISLGDLKKLAEHFDLSLIYFFIPDLKAEDSIELEEALCSEEVLEIVQNISKLDRSTLGPLSRFIQVHLEETTKEDNTDEDNLHV